MSYIRGSGQYRKWVYALVDALKEEVTRDHQLTEAITSYMRTHPSRLINFKMMRKYIELTTGVDYDYATLFFHFVCWKDGLTDV